MSGKRLSFSASDVKAVVAALQYIFINSAKYDVDDRTLALELEQLGIPNGNEYFLCVSLLKWGSDIVKVICQSYSLEAAKLVEIQSQGILKCMF